LAPQGQVIADDVMAHDHQVEESNTLGNTCCSMTGGLDLQAWNRWQHTSSSLRHHSPSRNTARNLEFEQQHRLVCKSSFAALLQVPLQCTPHAHQADSPLQMFVTTANYQAAAYPACA
jgi:hypothetical protein